MKIIEELNIEVDNDIYKGNCKFINLDSYPDNIDEYELKTVEVEIKGNEIDCFIATGTVEDAYGMQYEQINLYLLKDIDESLLDES
jgi:hypothetical protein